MQKSRTYGYEQSWTQRERAVHQAHFQWRIDDFPQEERDLTNTLHE